MPFNKAQTAQDIPFVLQLQTEIATTLVHEVGHAFDNLCHGRLCKAHFVGDSPVYEIEFELECRLFGGRLAMLLGNNPGSKILRCYKHDEQKSNLTGVLIMWEYPSNGIVHACSKTDELVPRADIQSIRPLDVARRVPLTFLQQLFDDSFWDNDFRRNTSLLRPKCKSGYCFRINDQGTEIPVIKSSPDEEVMYVPDGYRRLANGKIKAHGNLQRLVVLEDSYCKILVWRSYSPVGNPAGRRLR